jgi:hypothetical protein
MDAHDGFMSVIGHQFRATDSIQARIWACNHHLRSA